MTYSSTITADIQVKSSPFRPSHWWEGGGGDSFKKTSSFLCSYANANIFTLSLISRSHHSRKCCIKLVVNIIFDLLFDITTTLPHLLSNLWLWILNSCCSRRETLTKRILHTVLDISFSNYYNQHSAKNLCIQIQLWSVRFGN